MRLLRRAAPIEPSNGLRFGKPPTATHSGRGLSVTRRLTLLDLAKRVDVWAIVESGKYSPTRGALWKASAHDIGLRIDVTSHGEDLYVKVMARAPWFTGGLS